MPASNELITDAITQANLKVLGEAPAMAMATVYQAGAHSIGLALENSVATQDGMQKIEVAIVATSVKMILALAGS